MDPFDYDKLAEQYGDCCPETGRDLRNINLVKHLRSLWPDYIFPYPDNLEARRRQWYIREWARRHNVSA